MLSAFVRTHKNAWPQLVRRVRQSLTYVDSLDPTTRAIVQSAYQRAVQSTFVLTIVTAACALAVATRVREKPLLSS
jgi:hypothetical protein